MALSKEQCAEIVELYYKPNSPQTVIRMLRKSYQELLLKLNKCISIINISISIKVCLIREPNMFDNVMFNHPFSELNAVINVR